ncbi:MAG: PBP1A family penicillin-binding protein [Candidatus Cloacimonetes bacterium]|nr:PBP1A family penicillin-binding protein [Candidatus Cloacimonadota bacterium]
MKKYIGRYLLILGAITLFFSGIGAGLFWYYSNELPPLSELQRYDMKVGSEVYDRNDTLIHVFAVENRKLTNLHELPEYLIKGLIAVEDRKFRDHWGMDMVRFAKAILIDIQRRNFAQGASTITQQVARNMFLSLDKTIPRKIKEAMLAVRIEKHFSKDEILELYLNKSPFGPGIYGIEYASSKYFNKQAKDLSIPEAALLIGMPQLPSAYYPFRHPQRAIRRRNIVLGCMLDEQVISPEEYNLALTDTLKLYHPKSNRGAADYFLEYIRKDLERTYGTNKLFTGGLKIYTTLDIDLQTYADSILNKHLVEFETKNNYEVKYQDFPADTTDILTKYVQGAVFAIEPETGFVRVMIGGRNFNHSKLNRVVQSRRQPGSAFKPIVYSTALVSGYTPATVIRDDKISFIQSDTLFYNPHNYSLKNYGYLRMREALKFSRNIYAIKMLYDVTPRRVAQFARRFGLTTPMPPVYSMAIGTNVVYPAELISAYTTFPNGGERVTPVYIRRVEDADGKVLHEYHTERIRVIDEKVAYQMASMMQSVVNEGTGRGIRWRGYRWNAAGKTGTTDDFRDAWFVGYNKKLVCGIWVGFDDFSVLGRSKSGAVAALPPWPYIMKKAIELDAPKDSQGLPIIDGSRYQFIRPDGLVDVEISKETGLLPKSNYEETLTEIFIDGTQPTPLSDSLAYNFYPTIYRVNDKDSLVYDLGGRPYVWPDSAQFIMRKINFNKTDSLEIYPVINIWKDVDSLDYFLDGKPFRAPDFTKTLSIIADSSGHFLRYDFEPSIYRENDVDSVFYYLNSQRHFWPDSIIWRRKHVPSHIDLRGAQIIKDRRYVTRPDSALWWQWQPDSLAVPDSLDTREDALDKLFKELF